MFDIGFLEICLIAVIALMVFGPERLPGIARTAGHWVGRIRHFISTVKEDFDREMHLQELRDSMQQGELRNSLKDLADQTRVGLSDPAATIANRQPTIQEKTIEAEEISNPRIHQQHSEAKKPVETTAANSADSEIAETLESAPSPIPSSHTTQN